MKKLLTLGVVALLACGGGCQMLTGDHAHHGWFIGAWKPSSVDQQGVTLVTQNPGTQNANPMGTVSGPVIDAQSQHAPIMPTPVQNMPRAATFRNRIGPISAGECDPCQPATLTLQEWIKLTQTMKTNTSRMPTGEQ